MADITDIGCEVIIAADDHYEMYSYDQVFYFVLIVDFDYHYMKVIMFQFSIFCLLVCI